MSSVRVQPGQALSRMPALDLVSSNELETLTENQRKFTSDKSPQTTQDAVRAALAILSKQSSSDLTARERALQALVTVVNTATSKSISQSMVDAILETILPSGDHRGHPGEALTSLKILEAVLRRHTKSLAKKQVQDLLSFIQTFYDSSLALPWRRGAAGLRSQASSSSLRSMSSRRGSGTQNGKVGLSDTQSLALEALRVVYAMAKLDPVSLHPHWGSLFGNGPKSIIPLLRNDTTSDIRMAAVQALKEILRKSSAYIGLVSTQKAQVSFTSLSETLGQLVTDLNERLSDVIADDHSHSDAAYFAMVADVMTTVISATPYDKLRAGLLSKVVYAAGKHVESLDEAVVTALSSVLSAAAQASARSPMQSTATAAAFSAVLQQAETLVGQDCPPDLLAARWSALAGLCHRADALPTAEKLARLSSHMSGFSTASPHVQVQQVAALSASLECLMSVAGSQAGSDGPTWTPQVLEDTLTVMIKAVLQPKSSDSRVLGRLSLLTAESLANLGVDDMIPSVDSLLLRTVESSDVEARKMGCRAAGLLAQSESMHKNPEILKTLLKILLNAAVQDRAASVRADAAWSLAGYYTSPHRCELPDMRDFNLAVYDLAMVSCLMKHSSRDNDMIGNSGVRILGVQLAYMHDDLGIDRVRSGVQTLVETLLHSWPKMSWNAASALKAVLHRTNAFNATIIPALLQTLVGSKNVKVRASALSALQVGQDCLIHGDILDKLQKAIGSLQSLKAGLPFGELARAEQLEQELDLLLSRHTSHASPPGASKG